LIHTEAARRIGAVSGSAIDGDGLQLTMDTACLVRRPRGQLEHRLKLCRWLCASYFAHRNDASTVLQAPRGLRSAKPISSSK